MKKKYIGCFLLSMLFLSGCASLSKNDAVSAVKIANFPNITHAQALLIRADGDGQTLKDKHGKDIPMEWKSFNAGPAEVEALLADEIDIGYIGPGPAINAVTKSKGAVVIIAGSTNAGAILVARQDLPVSDIKGVLENHKVAVPQFGNTQDLCLRNLLQENNLQDSAKGGTVEVVQAQNPDIKTLLEKKEIDAALVPEPWGARLVNEAGARIILDDKAVWRNGEYTTAVVVVRKEFLQKHPDLVEAFLRKHVEATLQIRQDQEKNRAVVNRQIELLTQKALSDQVLTDAFARMETTYNPQEDSVQEMASMAYKAGFLRQEADIRKFFDLTILQKILSEKNLAPITVSK